MENNFDITSDELKNIFNKTDIEKSNFVSFLEENDIKAKGFDNLEVLKDEKRLKLQRYNETDYRAIIIQNATIDFYNDFNEITRHLRLIFIDCTIFHFYPTCDKQSEALYSYTNGFLSFQNCMFKKGEKMIINYQPLA